MVKPSYGNALRALGMVAVAATLTQAETLPAPAQREAGPTGPTATVDVVDSTADQPERFGQPERFRGEIVCLRARLGFVPQSASECPGGEDALALAIADSDAVQRLIPVDGRTHDMLVDRVGERVVIEGERYEGGGMIMASAVLSEPATE
jgi:hypothetical protein